MKTIIILSLTFLMSYTIINAQEKAGRKDTTAHVTVYTCTMHPDVTSDKPGKCPKCGKDLALSTKEQWKREVVKVYTCPVHTDVISDQPDKCPKCGKKLSLSLKEQFKAEVVKLYTCPMHPDMISDKPGKCPQCGMDMVVKKEKKKNE